MNAVTQTPATDAEGTTRPFNFRPLDSQLVPALRRASEDRKSRFFRHSRNDIMNLVLEEWARTSGYME